jgi:hypothetical protein
MFHSFCRGALMALFTVNAAVAMPAAMKKTALVCSKLEDAKKAAQMQSAARGALEAFLTEVVTQHRCQLFVNRGSIVLDEQNDGFSCVRPPGDLNCFWAQDAVVDEHPGNVVPWSQFPVGRHFPGIRVRR